MTWVVHEVLYIVAVVKNTNYDWIYYLITDKIYEWQCLLTGQMTALFILVRFTDMR